MNGALTLFEPRRTMLEPTPATSREAYQSIDLDAEAQAVLAMIAESPNGLTADQIEIRRGHGHQRFAELRRKGLIVANGRRRQTRSGRNALVYIAAPQSEK